MWNPVGGVARLVVFVQDAERAHGRGIDIGDKWVGYGARVDKRPLQLRRIIGDHDDPYAGILEVFDVLLQLPELRSTKGSPIDRAIGDEYRSLVPDELVDIRYFPALIQSTDSWELCSDREARIEGIRIFGDEYIVRVQRSSLLSG
jgi:hypothetical protein